MLRTINRIDSVYVKQQSPSGVQPQSCNISHKGNPNFERSPEYDDFQLQNGSGGDGAGKALGIIGAIALVIAGFAFHKGNKVLKGKNATILEKFKTGFKETLNNFKNIGEKFKKNKTESANNGETLTEKIKNWWNDLFKKERGGVDAESENVFRRTEKAAEEKQQTERYSFDSDMLGAQVKRRRFRKTKAPKLQKAEKAPEITHHKNTPQTHGINRTSLERKAEHEATNLKRAEGLQIKTQETTVKNGQNVVKQVNEEVGKVLPESRRISKTVSEHTAEDLRNATQNSVPRQTVPRVARTGQTAAKTVAKPKIRPYSKVAKTTAKPINKPARTVRRTSQRVYSQIDSKSAREIRNLEGNIKTLQQKIEGAEKLGRNTTYLKKELERSRQNLERVKSKAIETIEVKTPVKAAKNGVTNPMTSEFGVTSRRSGVQKQNMNQKSVKAHTKYPKQKVKPVTVEKSAGKQTEALQDLVNTPFHKISGVKDGNGVIKQYNNYGKLTRTIRNRGNGLVEVTEYNAHNSNGVSYYMRNGMIIKKADAGKQSENMRRLVHNLKGIQDKSKILRIAGSYAEKCGMKEVNETVMIGGKNVKIIYKGFDFDITADGRVLSKKFAADGVNVFHSDVTQQLSRETADNAGRNIRPNKKYASVHKFKHR